MGVGCWGRAPPAPGRSRTAPTRLGGMREVRGVVIVWQGRFETCPYVWDVRIDRKDWMLVDEGCAAPFVLRWGVVIRGR